MQRLGHIQRRVPFFISSGKKSLTYTFHSEGLQKINVNLLKILPKSSASFPCIQFHPTPLGCGFHTSQRRNVHPAIWLLLKPLFKISAAFTGRGVRKWYRRMDEKDKESFWTSMKKRWYLFAGAAGLFTGLFIVYYQSHIQETPITGRKRFIALTHDQIISISNAQAQSVIDENKDKIYDIKALQSQRVLEVAARLLSANPELRNMSFDKWEVFVVDDPLVNACVLPTGHVFVFKGMLDIANTQDELAIILGHEMAHALLEHGIEELSYGQFVDYIVILLMTAIWCVMPFDGIALVTQWFHNKMVSILTHLPHSRLLEKEADKVGAMLAAKACYDIRQGVVLWQKMEAANQLSSTESLPTFLSTHPHNLKRAEFFEFIIPKAEKWRDEQKCPHWPTKDPRQMIPLLSQIVSNQVAAVKTGQNLRRVQLANAQEAKVVGVTKANVNVKKEPVVIQTEKDSSISGKDERSSGVESKPETIRKLLSSVNDENKPQNEAAVPKASVSA